MIDDWWLHLDSLHLYDYPTSVMSENKYQVMNRGIDVKKDAPDCTKLLFFNCFIALFTYRSNYSLAREILSAMTIL